MVHARCVFCCRHSPVKDMNVRIFRVECISAQTRPRLILSSKRVILGGGGEGGGVMESEPMLTPREKIPSTGSPEEDGPRDTTKTLPTELVRPSVYFKEPEHHRPSPVWWTALRQLPARNPSRPKGGHSGSPFAL